MNRKSKKIKLLSFNKWSKERIKAGKKWCTSRTKIYNDPRVKCTLSIPLGYVKKYLWELEGADSPEEFEKVWRSIFRGKFVAGKIVIVHFGDFR